MIVLKEAFPAKKNPRSTPTGFEPVRAKHTRLAGEPLNHSGKVSRMQPEGRQKAWSQGHAEQKCSPSGNRTRVWRVRAAYPDHLD